MINRHLSLRSLPTLNKEYNIFFSIKKMQLWQNDTESHIVYMSKKDVYVFWSFNSHHALNKALNYSNVQSKEMLHCVYNSYTTI